MQSKLTTIFLGICAVCLVFLCTAIIFTAIKYAPGLNDAMSSLEEFSAQMEEMGTAMDSMVVATDQLKKIDFESVNQLVTEGRTSMAAAMAKIEEKIGRAHV